MSLAHGVETIKAFADTLSAKSGVYRMLDAHGHVLYVGKAKNLKKRVLSYTHLDKQSLRIQRMIARTHHMEFVETASEAEALLLESDLIKSLKPYYNILLRDDKSYPEIELSFTDGIAKIKKHRGVHRAGCRYFGPFANAGAVNTALDILKNVFQLTHGDSKHMRGDVAQHRRRYHVVYRHQFLRTFVPDGGMDEVDFDAYVNEVIAFLSGKDTGLLSRLQSHMERASQADDFETAMIYRDRVRALQDLHISQAKTIQGVGSADVIALCRTGGDTHGIVCIQVLFYRDSATAGSAVFFPRVDLGDTNAKILNDFIYQYYEDSQVKPAKKVYVSHALDADDIQALKSVHGTDVHVPKLGVGKRLVDMGIANAQSAVNRHKSHITTHEQSLGALCHVLGLADVPNRIEVYDNSHHQGDTPIGAMIVVGSDGFDKKSYRSWGIKTVMNRRDASGRAGDDTAMMAEVLKRRFTRAIREKSILPDLIVVDGGKGQLSTAQKTLAELGLHHIPIVCVAKGKKRNDGTETFYMDDKKIPINTGTDLHYFMERIRDEAHRFAITTHRKKRRKKILKSPLDDIEGIGKTRRTKLLQYFGSSTEVAGAGIADLMQVDGISKSMAQKIYTHFHGE